MAHTGTKRTRNEEHEEQNEEDLRKKVRLEDRGEATHEQQEEQEGGNGQQGEGQNMHGEGQSMHGQQGEGQNMHGEGQSIHGQQGEGQNMQGEGQNMHGEGKNMQGEGQNMQGEGQNMQGEGQNMHGQQGEGQNIHDQQCEGQHMHDQGHSQQGGQDQQNGGQHQQNHQAGHPRQPLSRISSRLVHFTRCTALVFPGLFYSISDANRDWLLRLVEHGRIPDPGDFQGQEVHPSTYGEWKIQQQWTSILDDYLAVEYRLCHLSMIPEERHFYEVYWMMADVNNVSIEMGLLDNNHPGIAGLVNRCRRILGWTKRDLVRLTHSLMPRFSGLFTR